MAEVEVEVEVELEVELEPVVESVSETTSEMSDGDTSETDTGVFSSCPCDATEEPDA